MSKSQVFCIAESHSQAGQIVERLQMAGFSIAETSLLLTGDGQNRDIIPGKETEAPGGATASAVGRGVTAGVVGLLVGIGPLAIPGLGPLIAAGPIVAALHSTGAGGIAVGLVVGLVGMGVTEIQAMRYDEKLRLGYSLVAVLIHTKYQETLAKDVFEQGGAEDITSTGLTQRKP